MTQDDQATHRGDNAAAPAQRHARARWRLLAALMLLVIIVLPVAAAGALWLRLAAGPVRFPAFVTGRIEARLDAAMVANQLNIGWIDISRPAGAMALDLALRDLRLTDPDGAPRAVFPAVIVSLSTRALLQGSVEPLRVDLQGAGLRLARDATGRIDLALLAGDTAAELGLAETLARLDRMFATPLLSRLETVRGRGLELVMADAITGQTMRVSDAEMRLERRDGTLTLRVGGALAGSRAATLDIGLSRGARAGVTEIALAFEGLAARDLATVGPALAWVDLMRAPISGQVDGVLADDGTLGDLALRLDIGPGHVRATQNGAAFAFDSLSTMLRYDARRGRILFERFDLGAPDLAFSASGHADPAMDGTRYTGQFQLTDIVVSRTDLWPDRLDLAGALVDFRLSLGQTVKIEIGQAVIGHDGRRLSAEGHLAMTPEGLDLSFDLAVPEITAPEVLGYWPVSLVPDTRRWLAANLSDARLSGVDVALRARPGKALSYAVGVDFTDAAVRVLPDLPAIEHGAGYLSLIGPVLSLRLDQGRMTVPGGGQVVLDGSGMSVADTRVKGAEAQIDVSLAGGLGDVLRLMQAPPVRLFAAGAMTPERFGTGTARMRAAVTTRLMRQEGMGDTRFDLSGDVTAFASDQLVRGRGITAKRLDFTVSPDALRVWGAARFDDLPLEGQWTRALGPDAPRASRLEAEAVITRDRLAALGVDLPDGLFSGQMLAALALDLPDGASPQLRVTSDLFGADLALAPLGWRQAADQRGQVSATIRLGTNPEVTKLDLAVGGLAIAGRAALTAGRGLDRLTAERFRLDGWLDVTGALIARGPGRAPTIEITGGTVDLRGAPQIEQGGGTHTPEGGPISVTLDRLQVTEGIAISPLLADLTTQGGLSGQFRGRVNGGAQVTGTLVSSQTGPAIRLRAADGGDVLRSAGVFRSAYGGEMELILQASGGPGAYDGLLRIDNPRLRDAPVLAEMLNVVSIVGLIDQLGGDGISMGEVEARFRVTPTRLILSEGVAVGPALGLSLDGSYDLASRELQMQGVISPLNVVNGVIGAIFSPRREGLFGFAYQLTGNAQSPQVTVNPFSILTPGVFREIFRRPPPSN